MTQYDDDDQEDELTYLNRQLRLEKAHSKSLREELDRKHAELALKSGEVDRVLAAAGHYAEWWSTGIVVAVERTQEHFWVQQHMGGSLTRVSNAGANYEVTLRIRSASHEGKNAGDYVRKPFKIIGV